MDSKKQPGRICKRCGSLLCRKWENLFRRRNGPFRFWEYDPSTDVWTSKAPLPNTLTQRIAAFSFAINGKGYMGGGYDTAVKKDFWEYDPAVNSCIKKPITRAAVAKDPSLCIE